MELETKSMFIRYISHEIRNPLNSVQLGLESLEEEMVKNNDIAVRLEILRDVKASLQISMGTLNDMLTSDKIRSGALSVERKELTLISLLSTIVSRYEAQVYLFHNHFSFNIIAYVYILRHFVVV